MQLQMEVCDLDECDFLETKFVEFDSYSDFKIVDSKKGIIMVFVKNGAPHYEYSQIHETDNVKFEEFMDHTMDKYSTNTDIVWVKNMYWYLHTFSCIFVQEIRFGSDIRLEKLRRYGILLFLKRK